MIDVLTYGETLAALRSRAVGPLRMGGELTLSMAGAESTVAIGVCRLGGTARWIGVLGDDELGHLVAMRLRAEGVLTDAIAFDTALPTSLLIKERRTAGRTRVSYYRRHGAGSALGPAHVLDDHLRTARIVHMTGITPALSASAALAAERAATGARRLRGTVSFDLNYRSALWDADKARPVLTALTCLSDIVFATVDEAALLTGSELDTPREAAEAIASLGPHVVVIKAGAQGAHLYADGSHLWADAVPVPEYDPVGAGDAFAAGFLAELARGGDSDRALHTAVRVAAVDVACEGDWEGLPSRTELAVLTEGGDAIQR